MSEPSPRPPFGAIEHPTPPHRRFTQRVDEGEGPAPIPATVPASPRFGFMTLSAMALATGLGVGLAELSLVLIRQAFWNQATLGDLQVNRHFLWMIPAANATLFLGVGAVIALMAFAARSWVSRFALYAYSSLALLTLLLMIHGLHFGAALLLAIGGASRIAPWLAKREAGLRRVVWRVALAESAVAAGLVGLDQWRSGAEARTLASLPAAGTGSANLLLIVLDTVRADRLSHYGYHRDTTPNLARLAARGITFDLARAPAPWTLPSHATVFTGRWPHELKVGQQSPLDESFPTLAEQLRDRGYLTGGFVSNLYYCNAWFGLGQGFARYEDFYEKDRVDSFEILRNCELGQRALKITSKTFNTRPGVVSYRKTAEQVNHDVLAWLDNRSSDHANRPFFAFLNYMDAHDPYIPPEDKRRFAAQPSPQDLVALHEWHTWPKDKLDARMKELISDSYDDCLAYLDRQIGRLFDDLERRGALDNTYVVITSDHGEQFGEHGLYLHGNSLHRPLLDVPLMILPPLKTAGSVSAIPPGARIAEPVTLRDIPATAIDLLGVSDPQSQSPFPGQSLARYWRPRSGSDASAVGPVLSEVYLTVALPESKRKRMKQPAMRGPMQSLAGGGHIYIRGHDGKEELYDAVNDRGETANLADKPESQPILERFRAEWATMFAR